MARWRSCFIGSSYPHPSSAQCAQHGRDRPPPRRAAPSIYKYFDSLLHIYDALFQRGQLEHLQTMRDAMADAQRGLPALNAGLEASGQWCLAHRSVAQLMFWRPVPSFEPSPEAFAPSIEMVNLQKTAIADAIAAGQLDPAEVDQVVHLISVFIVGVLSQAIANEPTSRGVTGASRPLFPNSWPYCPLSTRPRRSRTKDPTTGNSPLQLKVTPLTKYSRPGHRTDQFASTNLGGSPPGLAQHGDHRLLPVPGSGTRIKPERGRCRDDNPRDLRI